MVVALAVGCCLMFWGNPARADIRAEWPGTTRFQAIVLSVWLTGGGNVDGNVRADIDRECVAFLKAKLAEVAPDIEVLSHQEVTKQEHHATAAWAGYDVWLTPWHDTTTNRDVVLGAAILKIAAHGTNRTDFVPALFQSAPDQQSIAAAVQEAVTRHMMSAIVAPIERSLSK
jgi:hypothetical protein